MTSNRIVTTLLAMMMCMGLCAQKKTLIATMYHKNQTATVTLKSGKTVKAPNANVFLKNASLLYFQGNEVKEARMDIIDRVDFEQRSFINIENQLAYFVDSINGNSLYCVEIIDMDAFERTLKNNVNYTFIDLASDRLDTYTNDLNTEEDFVFPVVKHFYFKINDKMVDASLRDLNRVLDKQRYRLARVAASAPDFSWADAKCVKTVLEAISKPVPAKK